MKKEKSLSIILYVFSALALVYTCYVLFSAYSSYSSYGYGIAELVPTLISYIFTPLAMAIILYALGTMNDMLIKYLSSNTEQIKEEVKEVVKEETVEETKEEIQQEDTAEEVIESEEIVDKTNE